MRTDATLAESTAQGGNLRPRSYDLTAADIQALNDLMPQLSGQWMTNSRTDEGRNLQAYVVRRGSWAPYRQHFIIARHGTVLCLMASRIPYGPQLLGTFDSITDLTDALGDAIGWRRHQHGASSF